MTTRRPEDETTEVLLAHAEQTEQHSRLPAASLAALRRAGAFRWRTPDQLGGTWATGSALGRQLAELGRACPSAGWVAGTCATAKTLAARTLEDRALHDFFADPDALACGSGVPSGRGVRGADGVRVTGRWANVSGCEDAAWSGLGVLVDGAYCLAVIPVSELQVERTWQMAGMQGTGSHTLVAADVLVPAHRVQPAAPPSVGERLGLAVTVLAPVVGATRGALDTVEVMFDSDRKPFMTSHARMGDSPGARQWLAEATHLLGRAEGALRTLADVSEHVDLAEADSALLVRDFAAAGQDCRAATDLMLDLHGTSGLNSTHRLQRHWRDIAVGSRHPHLNPWLAVENLETSLVAGGRNGASR